VTAPSLRDATDLLHEVNWTIELTLREGSERLGPAGLSLPTLTAEWNVGELVFHLLLDAQRALVALAMTTMTPRRSTRRPTGARSARTWVTAGPRTPGSCSGPPRRTTRRAGSPRTGG